MSTSQPSTVAATEQPAESSSRWRFSLGTLFAVTALVAIGLGWWVNGPLKQARAIAEIRALGGAVNPKIDLSFAAPEPEPWLPPDYFGEIHEVRIHDAPPSRALAAIGQLSKIGWLDLSESDVTDDDLHHLRGLSIGALWLTGCDQITNDSMKSVALIRDLETLKLDSTNIGDKGLKSLAELTSLYHLGLTSTKITDAGLVEIGRHQQMQYLHLSESAIGDAGLSHLKGLRELDVLGLSETQVTDAGLVHLAGLTKLTALDLSSTAIRDGGLAHFAKLQKLKELELGKTGVTRAGMKHVLTLKSLELLGLSGLRLADDDLIALSALPELESLHLFDVPLTQAGLDRLWEQESRPMVIYLNNPALSWPPKKGRGKEGTEP